MTGQIADTTSRAPLSRHAVLDPLQWIGRAETLEDVVTAAPVASLSATLDNGNPAPGPGDPLPPLWHWLYFVPRPRRSEIGPDGHALGGFLPPVPLPRRMWAGGRLAWHDPRHIGDAVTRVSRVEDVLQKSGTTGGLLFVLVGQALLTGRGLALTEEHDLVCRGLPAAGSSAPPPPRARSDEAWCERIVPDDVLLFRYSAPAFNAHRGRPSGDSASVDLWARNAGGGLAMQATATLASESVR